MSDGPLGRGHETRELHGRQAAREAERRCHDWLTVTGLCSQGPPPTLREVRFDDAHFY